MNIFDQITNSVLGGDRKLVLEALKGTTIPRNSLDPELFQFNDDTPPILQPMIKLQIFEDAASINRIVPIKDFIITGDVLSYNWNPKSRLEVNIIVDPELLVDMKVEAVYKHIKTINGRLAGITTHPIFYYIIQTDFNPSKSDGAYDPANEKWLKEPSGQLGESIVDYAHGSLDPKVWDASGKEPKIKSSVKNLIMTSLKEYLGVNFNLVDYVNITGSIGTQQWKSDTDIDVHIVPKNIDRNKQKYEILRTRMKHAFEKKDIRVGNHPVEVYLQLDPEQESRGDASYNLTHDKWNKKPFDLSNEFDPDVEFAYLDKDLNKIFKQMDISLGELRRDLVDYDIIKDYIGNLSKEEKSWLSGKLDKKLEEIETTINNLVDKKNEYHKLRKSSYGPEDENRAWDDVLKSKSWAPGNVMWKILDRYKYVSLIVNLQRAIEDGELDASEVSKVKKSISFEEYIPEGITKRSASKGRWKDPLARHSMSMARGFTRKKLTQVSDDEGEFNYGDLERTERILPHAERILNIAKEADQGIWKLTKRQLLEIVEKYGLKVPTKEKPTKRLGKTKIVLWRRGPAKYYIAKLSKSLYKPAKSYKKYGKKGGRRTGLGMKG